MKLNINNSDKMGNKKNLRKSIELIHEKSGDIVRVIRFKNTKDFYDFLYAYKSMRYPGYKWRYCNNNVRKGRLHEAKN
jgi:hypothetical protein